jgi:hypothetical protein
LEIFRLSKDAWGQETLNGVSWDLLSWFFGAAVLFIVVHILYKWFFAPKAITSDSNSEDGTPVSKK